MLKNRELLRYVLVRKHKTSCFVEGSCGPKREDYIRFANLLVCPSKWTFSGPDPGMIVPFLPTDYRFTIVLLIQGITTPERALEAARLMKDQSIPRFYRVVVLLFLTRDIGVAAPFFGHANALEVWRFGGRYWSRLDYLRLSLHDTPCLIVAQLKQVFSMEHLKAMYHSLRTRMLLRNLCMTQIELREAVEKAVSVVGKLPDVDVSELLSIAFLMYEALEPRRSFLLPLDTFIPAPFEPLNSFGLCVEHVISSPNESIFGMDGFALDAMLGRAYGMNGSERNYPYDTVIPDRMVRTLIPMLNTREAVIYGNVVVHHCWRTHEDPSMVLVYLLHLVKTHSGWRFQDLRQTPGFINLLESHVNFRLSLQSNHGLIKITKALQTMLQEDNTPIPVAERWSMAFLEACLHFCPDLMTSMRIPMMRYEALKYMLGEVVYLHKATEEHIQLLRKSCRNAWVPAGGTALFLDGIPSKMPLVNPNVFPAFFRELPLADLHHVASIALHNWRMVPYTALVIPLVAPPLVPVKNFGCCKAPDFSVVEEYIRLLNHARIQKPGDITLEMFLRWLALRHETVPPCTVQLSKVIIDVKDV